MLNKKKKASVKRISVCSDQLATTFMYHIWTTRIYFVIQENLLPPFAPLFLFVGVAKGAPASKVTSEKYTIADLLLQANTLISENGKRIYFKTDAYFQTVKYFFSNIF